MAKNNPLTICNIKQIPTRDPKFHKVEILEGPGKSIKELLTIFNKLCVFRGDIKSFISIACLEIIYFGITWKT
jgi:hypothetical protein